MSGQEGSCRFAVNKGVRIHYHLRGSGPPVVLLHGYPEYWNVWLHQIAGLSRDYCVIVPDLRGFNLSDRPKGVEQYFAGTVGQDVLTILADLSFEKAAVVGNDIGGMVAWWLASHAPEHVDRLATLSAPHPIEHLLARRSPPQREASRYIDRFLDLNHANLLSEKLTFWLKDLEERAALEAALSRSDAQAVASYYRANLSDSSPFLEGGMREVVCRTLVIYSDDDPYILPQVYDGTWRWVLGPLTMTKLAGKGHFLHHSAADLVISELRGWLATP